MGGHEPAEALLEREQSLAVLRSAVHGVAAGSGSCLFIEGPWGVGKSALLTSAVQLATDAGTIVLAASGSILERDLAWGLAAALLRPAWTRLQQLQQLQPGFGGRPEEATPSVAPMDPEALCRELVVARGHTADRDGATVTQIARGLSLILQDLSRSSQDAGGAGLLIAVDDAHWVDPESLRLLAHLAQRSHRLPTALVFATRPGGPLAEPRAEAALRSVGRRLRPASLGEASVSELVARRFPGADPRLGAECARLTGGNPALLGQVLDHLAGVRTPAADAGASLLDVVPERVHDWVAGRLGVLDPVDRRIAQSIALLGSEATVLRVAALAGVDADTVLNSADGLACRGLLTPELPLAVAPPLIEAAVLNSLLPFDRARAHLRAAQILRAQRGDPDAIADHLLRAPPNEDPEMITPLRDAAQRASAHDDPERAVALLLRALGESPEPGLRLALVTDLAWAQADTQGLTVHDRLHDVRQSGSDPVARARLALAEGHALYAHGHHAQAAQILGAGAEDLDRGETGLHDALTAVQVICVSMVQGRRAEALASREALLHQPPETLTPTQRAAVAHTLIHDVLGGAARTRVRHLADVAWGDGALLEAGPLLRFGAPLLCASLVLADELERAIDIIDAIRDAPRSRPISAAEVTLTCVRAWALYLQGAVGAALGAATDVLDGPGAPGRFTEAAAQALIVTGRLEEGRIEVAQRLLTESASCPVDHPIAQALWLVIRARVRLAEHRAQDALQDALDAGRALREPDSDVAAGLVPWRSTGAMALLALGEPERAEALVREELSQAGTLGNQQLMTRGLRILGLRLAADGLDTLARAVEVSDLNGPRLERVRALVDYGAALRRHNRRAAAREPLRRGLHLGHQGGAQVLEDRARAELTASGARPRRAAVTGVASLTASQQRVAQLAASGLTTRQIADVLFVTPKTVEFHLHQTYRKLDINSRAGLAELLGAA